MFYRMLRRERGLAQAGLLRIRAATRENAPSDETNFVFTRISGIRTDIWAVRVKGDAFHKVDPKPVRLTAGPLGFFHHNPVLIERRSMWSGTSRVRSWFAITAVSVNSHRIWADCPFGQLSFSPDGQWIAYTIYPDALSPGYRGTNRRGRPENTSQTERALREHIEAVKAGKTGSLPKR
jgi:hypothetical protein